MRSGGGQAEVRYQDIVNSLDRALVVLDDALVVHYANLAYYRLTNTGEDETVGRPLAALWNGALADDRLSALLESIVPHGIRVDAFQVEQTFPVIGRRVLRVAAREIARDGADTGFILLAIDDVTGDEQERRRTGAELDRIRTMIDEVHHRVKNNVAAITAMIRLETRQLADADARAAFDRVASRIDYLATLYELLAVRDRTGEVELLDFFKRVCDSIEKLTRSSAVGWTIRVLGDQAETGVDDAVRLGAIVHELVANAAKYAFEGRQDIGLIVVEVIRRTDTLVVKVADNGCGIAGGAADPQSTGIGMRIVELYLDQMNGTIRRDTDGSGTRYTIAVPMATRRGIEDVVVRRLGDRRLVLAGDAAVLG